jgi:hypothetical protein
MTSSTAVALRCPLDHKDLPTASNGAESLNPRAPSVVSTSAPSSSKIGRNQSIARRKIKIRLGK